MLFTQKSVQRYCFFLNWQNFCMFFFIFFDFICRYEIFFVPLHAKYTRVKRALYILGVLLAGLALVGGTFITALSSDKVKTAAVRLAAAELSRALGTNAQVGSVSYQFPARITIKDIYLEDRQGDTLAYVGEVFAQFSPLALRHGEIKFSHVRLNDVLADVHQVEIPSAEGASTKEWNYQFLVDAFDGSGHGHEHIGGCLDGFDDAERFPSVDECSDLWQFDEGDFAEFIGGEVCDSDLCDAVRDFDPLVFLCVLFHSGLDSFSCVCCYACLWMIECADICQDNGLRRDRPALPGISQSIAAL